MSERTVTLAIPEPKQCYIDGHGLHCSDNCPLYASDDQIGWCGMGWSLPVTDPKDENMGDHWLRVYSYCRVPGPGCPWDGWVKEKQP